MSDLVFLSFDFTLIFLSSLFSADGMNESHTGDVELQNIKSDIMDVLIEYIYKREFRVNADNAANLFVAADRFQISPLVGKCLEGKIENESLGLYPSVGQSVVEIPP